jgi:hypothetical protein
MIDLIYSMEFIPQCSGFFIKIIWRIDINRWRILPSSIGSVCDREVGQGADF